LQPLTVFGQAQAIVAYDVRCSFRHPFHAFQETHLMSHSHYLLSGSMQRIELCTQDRCERSSPPWNIPTLGGNRFLIEDIPLNLEAVIQVVAQPDSGAGGNRNHFKNFAKVPRFPKYIPPHVFTFLYSPIEPLPLQEKARR
jgi:hypothetical protein